MKFNVLSSGFKRALSIFNAVAIIAASIPLAALLTSVDVVAEGSSVSFQDENASLLVEGNEPFSIAGEDTSDKTYFYAKNAGSETLGITFKDISLEAGKKYTLDFDVYTLRLSLDEQNALLGLRISGETGVALEAYPSNSEFLEEAWGNYHTSFTAVDSNSQLDFYLYKNGKVIIDNLVLIDENGVETALDYVKACEETEHPEHFSAATLYEIANEEDDIPNGYIKAEVPVSGTISENKAINIPLNLDEALTAGKYTLSMDVRFSTFGSNGIAMCISMSGMNVKTLQSFHDKDEIALKKQQNISATFELTPEYTWIRLNVYQGGTVTIDNIKLVNSLDETVVLFDCETPVQFSGDDCFVQKGIPEPERSDISGKYLNISVPANSDKVNDADYIEIPFAEALPAGQYNFSADVRLTDVGTCDHVFAVHYANYGTENYTCDPNQYFTTSTVKLDETVTVGYTFNTEKTVRYLRLHVYQGQTVRFDNIKVTSADETVNYVYDFEDFSIAEDAIDNDSIASIGDTADDVAEDTEENTEPYLEIDVPADISSDYVNVYLPIEDNSVGGSSLNVQSAGRYTLTLKADAARLGSGNTIAEVSLCTSTAGANARTFTFTKDSFEETTAAIANLQKRNYTYLRIRVYKGVKLEIYDIDIRVQNAEETSVHIDFESETTVYDNSSVSAGGYAYCSYVIPQPEKIVNQSGMNIAFLRGRAGKEGAALKLGGANSALTLKDNTSYKLSVLYYQANPTISGNSKLFSLTADADIIGAESDAVNSFKKNNSEGWTTATLLFTTGMVADNTADWLTVTLEPQAWVYFDEFSLTEQAIDSNVQFDVVDFEEPNDAVYPKSQDGCFYQTNSLKSGYTSNGSNGWFYANNPNITGMDTNVAYEFSGIRLKSNTTYRVSIDYYVAKPYTNDFAFAFGYSPINLGISSSGQAYVFFSSNESVIGWHTASYTVTTGEVVPNANYIKLAVYDGKTAAREIYFDNLSFTELYRIDTSVNDSALGTVTNSTTVEGGGEVKVVASPFDGVKFEGWYEYGDLVSADTAYRIKNVDDNHKLEARFSGTAIKPEYIVQDFEDYDVGNVKYEYYEIVDDKKNIFEGNRALHIKNTMIEVNADHSIFFPLVSNVEAQFKDDSIYDVYVWIKPIGDIDSKTYFALTHSIASDVTSNWSAGIQQNISPTGTDAVEEKNGWYKYYIGTVTKSIASREGFNIHIGKFNMFRSEGASIDEMYVDNFEVIERVPDYANMKYTEKLYDLITNSDFESAVTDKNWAPLTNGLSVEKIENAEYEWQGDYLLKFDAAKSGGEEYVRVIPIPNSGKNYTFAAWSKLTKGSDITVGLYADGNYTPFESVVNGESGKLPLIDDNKWNRVSFTFNAGDSNNAYLVIKGSKGTLQLDMVELFLAKRGHTQDPNEYSIPVIDMQMFDPIAFPDTVMTDTIYIDNDDDLVAEEEEETDKTSNTKKVRRVIIKKKGGGISVWLWVGIGAGAVVLAAATVLFIILFKKRKRQKKEAA